jgi:dTDP-L-rhamnose 4-epimerase
MSLSSKRLPRYSDENGNDILKILVTGGAGFIGSWLVGDLLAGGHSVRVLDSLIPQIHGAIPKFEAPWMRDADSRVEMVRADIRDSTALDYALEDVEAVVHLAAETGTGQSMYKISHYCEVNFQATAKLLEGIAKSHRNVGRVVFASSRSVYGEGAYELHGKLYFPEPRTKEMLASGRYDPVGPRGEPLRLVATPESAEVSPASIYAATKLASEGLGRIFSNSYGMRFVALRFQNVYGERQSLNNPYTGLLSIFSNLMRKNLPINVFEDGHESRDFVHVSDVSRAICLSLDADLPNFSIFNIGSGSPTSIIKVAGLLKQELGSESVIKVSGDYRIGDIRHCYASLDRAKQFLGFTPAVSLVEGMRRFCRWVILQEIATDRSSEAMTELAKVGLGRSWRTDAN